MQRREPSALAPKIEGENPYMPGIGKEDLRPPEYRLVQNTSAAVHDRVAAPGQFYSAQTGEALELVEGPILFVQPTRVLWDGDELGPPRCASDNAVTPRAGGEFEGPCATCPMRDKDCTKGYTFFGLRDGNAEHPFLVRFQTRTSIVSAQNFITTITSSFRGRPFAAWSVLRSLERENKKGHFYVPQLRAERASTKEELARFEAATDYYVARRSQLATTPDEADSSSIDAGKTVRRGPEQPAATVAGRSATPAEVAKAPAVSAAPPAPAPAAATTQVRQPKPRKAEPVPAPAQTGNADELLF